MNHKTVGADFFDVSGKNCIGCRNEEQDVLISIGHVNDPKEGIDFTDIYLSQYLAEKLYEKLGRVLTENKEN